VLDVPLVRPFSECIFLHRSNIVLAVNLEEYEICTFDVLEIATVTAATACTLEFAWFGLQDWPWALQPIASMGMFIADYLRVRPHASPAFGGLQW